MKSEAVKALEQKLNTLEADFQSFAYAVSHDVASPLRHIDGFTRRVLKRNEDTLDEESLRDLGIVLKSVTKCQGDLDAIKKYSRLSTKFRPCEEIDFNAIVNSCIREYADETERVGATIEHLPLQSGYGDPLQIKLLFACLIENALRYHSKDEIPKVQISGEIRHSYQHITVRDNGIGIPERQHDKVFVMFRRAVIPDQYEGQGCGLAYVKRIVMLHEGEISLASEEGFGTTIKLSFPLKIPQA